MRTLCCCISVLSFCFRFLPCCPQTSAVRQAVSIARVAARSPFEALLDAGLSLRSSFPPSAANSRNGKRLRRLPGTAGTFSALLPDASCGLSPSGSYHVSTPFFRTGGYFSITYARLTRGYFEFFKKMRVIGLRPDQKQLQGAWTCRQEISHPRPRARPRATTPRESDRGASGPLQMRGPANGIQAV